MVETTTDRVLSNQVAFNDGCDYRLAGVPIKDNPYADSDHSAAWLSGWRHTNSNWGKDARWPIRPLPLVLKEARRR